MAKGKTGALLSKPNLIKTAFAAAVAVFAYNKLKEAADDPAKKDTWTAKAAGILGFKGPGIA